MAYGRFNFGSTIKKLSTLSTNFLGYPQNKNVFLYSTVLKYKHIKWDTDFIKPSNVSIVFAHKRIWISRRFGQRISNLMKK